MDNINTRAYWENRFSTGDWEEKHGRSQTARFAEAIVTRIKVPNSFSGTILDFGCGLGDATPVYRSAFPKAHLIGVDISPAAVVKCREQYGLIAQFFDCDHLNVPTVDVIISSNVFEHLTSDKQIARSLLEKCKDLFIVTPYRERIVPGTEHVNSYETTSFSDLGCCATTVYPCKGWSQYGLDLWLNIYLKNAVRPLFGKETCRRSMQIMFHLTNHK